MDSGDEEIIIPHFGSAVEGRQRFARPGLEARLLRLLKTSNGVTMFGLRRTAKSTFTRWAEQALREEGMVVISIDAQGFRALDQLLYEIVHALAHDKGLGQRMMAWATGSDAVPAILRKALEQAAAGFGIQGKDERSAISDYWMVIADQIAKGLREDPRPQMFLSIDEFPFMCKGILDQEGSDRGRTTVNQLLAALRLWRDAGLKMLLTGSIGMAALERRYQLDPVHLNDLRPFSVPPLGERDPQEPTRFVKALERGTPELVGWTPRHTEMLLEESVALYPSFLQFAFLHLANNPLPAPEEFPEIFACEIRPHLNEPFLDQFDTRLRVYRELGEGTESAACTLMGVVVTSHPGQCTRQALAQAVSPELDPLGLAELLRLLHEDGFLAARTERDGTQSFRLSSGLVLTWWHQRGLGSR